jgi:hypothetical protein
LPASGWQELDLLRRTNQARSQAGVPALEQDEALALAARHHALEMAELSYLDHESPRAGNRTLQHRLARAGAAVQGAGENLALLNGDADLAQRAISGWLDSPGHRRNLLAADFTHVGFGVATSARGETLVAQVLGRKQLDLIRADVSALVLETKLLQIDFQLLRSAEVAFWLAGENTPPATFGPGRHSVSHPWNPQALAQLYSGVKSPAGATFIRMDGGWFDPVAGQWSPGARNGSEELLIDSVRSGVQSEDVWRVNLGFGAAPRSELGVWVGGEWLGSFELNGRTLQLDVPRSETAPLIEVGLRQGGPARQYEIALRFSVEAAPGESPRISLLH